MPESIDVTPKGGAHKAAGHRDQRHSQREERPPRPAGQFVREPRTQHGSHTIASKFGEAGSPVETTPTDRPSPRVSAPRPARVSAPRAPAAETASPRTSAPRHKKEPAGEKIWEKRGPKEPAAEKTWDKRGPKLPYDKRPKFEAAPPPKAGAYEKRQGPRFGVTERSAPTSASFEKPRSRDSREGTTALFIGAGSQAGIRPGDLVGAIANEAGVPSRNIGPIQISERHSLVGVPSDMAMDVIAALRKTTIRGRKVQVRRDVDAAGSEE